MSAGLSVLTEKSETGQNQKVQNRLRIKQRNRTLGDYSHKIIRTMVSDPNEPG